MKNRVFFITSILTIMILMTLGIAVRGVKEVSIVENRSLNQFPQVTIGGFLSTDFQNQIEAALSDQLLLAGTLKAVYSDVKQVSMTLMTSTIFRNRLTLSENPSGLSAEGASNMDVGQDDNGQVVTGSEPLDIPLPSYETLDGQIVPYDPLTMTEKVVQIKNFYKSNMSQLNYIEGDDGFQLEYVPIGNNLLRVVDEDHLIFLKAWLEYSTVGFETKANRMNDLKRKYPQVDFYNFYIESDVDVDFMNGKFTHDLSDYLGSLFDEDVNYQALELNDLETYFNGFYKTDHHWDVFRQIEGYRGLVEFIFGQEEALLDFDLYLTNLKYNGYKSRSINVFDTYDPFMFIVPQMDDYKVYINGSLGTYNHKDDFISGNFKQVEAENYYGDCNGADYGLVHFETGQSDKPNAVFFIDSFSNPLKDAIASHFNNTYFVDFRYYDSSMEEAFDFGDFIMANDIEVAVNMGYYYFFVGDTFLIND